MTANTSVQYVGMEGITKECLDALRRLIQYSDPITAARVVSCGHHHAMLLTVGEHDLVAIRSGFASGYLGEGSSGFSSALQLLESQRIEVEEVDVDDACLERLNTAALTESDCDHILKGRPVRPSRFYDYIHFRGPHIEEDPGDIYHRFPVTMPYRIIDGRLMDLALRFNENADAALLTAFRRLEDAVRKRSALDEHGAKLFSQAFGGKQAPLVWKDLGHENEIAGRVNLFTGVYMTHRNPRAHSDRSVETNLEAMLSEFLLVNHLFLLERAAVAAPPATPVLTTPHPSSADTPPPISPPPP